MIYGYYLKSNPFCIDPSFRSSVRPVSPVRPCFPFLQLSLCPFLHFPSSFRLTLPTPPCTGTYGLTCPSFPRPSSVVSVTLLSLVNSAVAPSLPLPTILSVPSLPCVPLYISPLLFVCPISVRTFVRTSATPSVLFPSVCPCIGRRYIQPSSRSSLSTSVSLRCLDGKKGSSS